MTLLCDFIFYILEQKTDISTQLHEFCRLGEAEDSKTGDSEIPKAVKVLCYGLSYCPGQASGEAKSTFWKLQRGD